MKATRHPNNYEPWYAGDAEVYYVSRYYYYSGGDQPMMYNGKWDYDPWVFTWTGWHSSLKWESVGKRMRDAPKGSVYINFVQFWELDPLVHDGLFHDPWFEWDCDSDFPLIGWAISLICDLIQNNLQWGNDDWIGTVSVNLTNSEQRFDGNGINVKMYYRWYDDKDNSDY